MFPHPFKASPNLLVSYAGNRDSKILSGIVVGMIALNLLVGAALWWMVYRSNDQANQAAQQMVAGRAQRIDASVSRTIDTVAATLTAAGYQYRLLREGKTTGDALNLTLRRAGAALQTPYGVGIADRTGLITHGTARRMEGQVSINNSSYFATLRDNPKAAVAISPPLWSKTASQWSIVVAKRIAEAGDSFEGIVYTAIPIESLTQVYSELSLSAKDVVELRDDRMTLLARFPASNDPAAAVGSTRAPTSLLQFAASPEQHAMLRTEDTDGGKRLYAYRKIAGKPIYVVSGAATQTLSDAGQEVAVGALLAWVIFAIMSFLISRWFYRVWRHESEAAMALAASENAFRCVFDNAPVGMEIVSLDGKLLQVNLALCELLGYPMGELLGKSLSLFTDMDDIEKDEASMKFLLNNAKASLQKEKRYIHHDGHTIWTQRTVILARDKSGNPSFLIAQIEDISQRKAEQNQVEGFANYDTLTGLPNRRSLMDKLARGLKQAAWNHHTLVLMFIDLDGFKKINDTLGHDVGDEILKAAAGRLSSCVRGEDFVARQGGDEFVIILKEVGEPSNAALVAKKVVSTMAVPIKVGNHSLGVTASIGVAVSLPAGGVEMDELIKQADTAMYWTKQAGRNGYTFYDNERDQASGNAESKQYDQRTDDGKVVRANRDSKATVASQSKFEDLFGHHPSTSPSAVVAEAATSSSGMS